MNMIFPSDRSYRVFQKTGNPWVTLALTIIFLASLLLPFSSAEGSDFDISGEGKVTWVADGDTMAITPHNPQLWHQLRTEAVRAQNRTSRDLRVNKRFNNGYGSFLTRIGSIDTAESSHPDEARNTVDGDMAAQYAKELMLGAQVQFRCYEIGHYGRPICSIKTAEFDFGRHMIRQNMSNYVTRFGNHPFYHHLYVEAASH